MIMAFCDCVSSKQMQMEYRYDDQGYPLGKTTKSNDKTLSVSATPSTDPIVLDYTAVTLLNNQRVGNVKQSCEYDSHANPVDCQLIIVDEGVKPAVERFTPSKILSIIINAIVRSASGV